MNYKLILASLLTFGFLLPIHAQVTDAGNFVIGGNFGFSTASSSVTIQNEGASINTDGRRATQLNISPALGYFLMNNWVLGIGLDYTVNKIKEPVDITDPNTDFTTDYDSDLLFGPYTRVYLPVADDMAFFLEANFGFGSSTDEINLGNEKQTASNNVLAIGVGPGFTIFSNDAIGIEALVQYNWARSNYDLQFQGIRSETTTYTNAIDFSIGLQVYFTRLQPATSSYDNTPDRKPGNNTGSFY